MKISETSGKRYAIIEGIECRLTTRSRSKEAKELKNNLGMYEIDTYGIYRDTKGFAIGGSAIVIPSKIAKVEKIMNKMGYTEYDVDAHTYALVKLFR